MTTIDKAIIGLGCSWTQGEGGYPDELWKKYNGRINLPMGESKHLIPIEWENSWVNVLCRDYFTDYVPINLGQRGMGNRGAARSLYLTNIDFDKIDDAIVIFMLSGQERFDFFRQDFVINNNVEHPYKIAHHYNFQTVWPNEGKKLWKIYFKQVWSELGSLMETLCSIIEVQTFCKAYGFKFVLANAFSDLDKSVFVENCGALANQIDWNNYIHEKTTYKNFLEHLVDVEDWLQGEDKYHYYHQYYNLKWPKKYLTNCIHPTIDGYKEMANELQAFIKQRHF